MKHNFLSSKAILVIIITFMLFTKADFAQDTYLLNEIKPFSTTGWYWEFGSTIKSGMGGANSMTMGGKKYTNGFKFGEPGTATFNLGGKYTQISGDIGLDDFENKKDTAVSFYADGKLIEYIELKAQMLPKKFTVNVSGVSQLQIKKEVGYSEVNLASINISKETNTSVNKIVEPTLSLKDGVYLLDLVTPYDKGRFYWPFGKVSKSTLGGENSMTMGGKKYYNGFKLGEPGYAIFNLEGKYKSMLTTIGLDDFENKKSTSVDFIGDGVLIKRVELSAGMLPVEISLDVTGVKQFKVLKNIGYSEVDIAQIQVSKNEFAAQNKDTSSISNTKDTNIVNRVNTSLTNFQSVAFDNSKLYDRPTKVGLTSKESVAAYARDSKNAMAELAEIEVLNDALVSVGSGGIIYSSNDKKNWKVTNANTFDNLEDIAFGSGKYLIASSRGYLAWSTDLKVWNDVDTSKMSKEFKSIVYHNGEFLVLCENGIIYSSKDGKTFTKKTQVTMKTNQSLFTKIEKVGDQLYLLNATGAYSSKDASNWKSLNLVYKYEMDGKIITSSEFTCLDIASGSGSTIITGVSGYFTSKDGINWTYTSIPNAPKNKNNTLIQEIKSISYHNNEFRLFVHEFSLSYKSDYLITVDKDGKISNSKILVDKIVKDSIVYKDEIVTVWNGIQVSKDGLTFKSMDMDFAQADFSEANGYYFISNGKYLTVSDKTKQISKSIIPFTYSSRGIKEVAYGKGIYVAVGDEQTIITSKDLKTWKSANDNMKDHDVLKRPTISSVIFYNNKFIAMDYSGYQYDSVDGINWSRKQVSKGYDSLKIEGIVNGNLMAVGMYEHRPQNGPMTTYALVLSSTDGSKWTPYYIPRIDRATSISYLNGIYLVEGLSTMFATTKDLKNYQIYEIDNKNINIRPSGKFVQTPGWQGIVANEGKYYGLIYAKTSDGEVNERIGAIVKSTDGVNWVWQETKGEAEIVSLKVVNGSVIAVTRNGDLLTIK